MSDIVVKTSDVLESLYEFTGGWSTSQIYFKVMDSCLKHEDYYVYIEDSEDAKILQKFIAKVYSALYDNYGKNIADPETIKTIARLIIAADGSDISSSYVKYLNDDKTYALVFYCESHSKNLSKSLTTAFLSD